MDKGCNYVSWVVTANWKSEYQFPVLAMGSVAATSTPADDSNFRPNTLVPTKLFLNDRLL
jgi:hypothetical protein